MMITRVLNAEFDEHFAIILTRTICSIILQDDSLLIEDFRKHEMIPLLISKEYITECFISPIAQKNKSYRTISCNNN